MLDGPLGMKVMLRSMAIREGQNLDELDPFSLEKDDPVKADFEELMCAMGITAQDLKDGIVSGPEDDDDEWYRINKNIPQEEDFTDWPKIAQEEDPWRKYRDANGQVVPPIFNNSKKLDDDVPTPPPPPPAGGDDKQMDEMKNDDDDDVLLCLPSVITYGRRGCKRTNDDEIKKKKKKKKDDGGAAADKQAEG